MTARLVEFMCSPQFDVVDGLIQTTWMSKMTVDLRWVAGVRPYAGDRCEIAMAGYGQWYPIDCSYPDFMEKWTALDKPLYVYDPGPAGAVSIGNPGGYTLMDVPE